MAGCNRSGGSVKWRVAPSPLQSAARAGVGHGEGGRDALGREEQVAGLCTQLLVKVHGEGIVALNQRCLGGVG